MTTNRANPSAAQTYAARRVDIDRLLDVLQTELAKHEAQHKAAPADWGFAGDLYAVRSALIEAVERLSGNDRVEIERFLAE